VIHGEMTGFAPLSLSYEPPALRHAPCYSVTQRFRGLPRLIRATKFWFRMSFASHMHFSYADPV
jgi:hypothetical protein